jgi:hypothetical protein
MAEAKTFIYRYDNDSTWEEEETDFEGCADVPRIGDLLYRKRKVWKVTGVFTGFGTAVPCYRVLLTDVSKPHLVN